MPPATALSVDASTIVIAADADRPKPPFHFTVSDQALLDEIEHATFNYFWQCVSPTTAMVYDRTSSTVISSSGVGFQLAALPIGVERGWITRDEGTDRALTILRAFDAEPDNRKAGLFYHFLDADDASPKRVGTELVVSTVDSSILFSGMIVAGQYFGGEVSEIADRMFADADWNFFGGRVDKTGMGESPFISLGWKPTEDEKPRGNGQLLPYFWIDSGDEHRLVTFLAISAPMPSHRADPDLYWQLRRQLGWHEGAGHVVWFPYSGALFTSFFAHCFINYAALGVDHPHKAGVTQRAQVDWWENSRRIVQMHRDRAIENPLGLPTLGPNAWGLSACDGPDGYLVPGLYPTPVEMLGATPERDFAAYQPTTSWGGGVVPPYAAGASIMFEPRLAMESLRYYRGLNDSNHTLSVWRGHAPQGWGFADAFRLDQKGQLDWVASDFVSIDQGPLLLGIENARSALIWDLFTSHPAIKAGFDRLGIR